MQLVEYHNKTRKGLHVVIQLEGETKRTTYKYDASKPLDYYAALALGSTPKGKKNYETFIKKHSHQSEKLSNLIQPGVTQVQLKLEELGQAGMQQRILHTLLKPLVLDEELLNIVIANHQKLRHRFTYKLEIHGTSSKNKTAHTIARITDIGTKTPEEAYTAYGSDIRLFKGRILSTGEIPSEAKRNNATGQQFDSSPVVTQTYVHILFQRGQ